jgi:DNA-binding XRE family transcriptional regulator
MPQVAKPGIYGIQPVKKILSDRGITHLQAAQALGIPTHSITMICNGNTSPSLGRAAQLARFLDLHIEDLFSDQLLYGKEAKPRRKK